MLKQVAYLVAAVQAIEVVLPKIAERSGQFFFDRLIFPGWLLDNLLLLQI